MPSAGAAPVLRADRRRPVGPADQGAVRRHNLALVLALLSDEGPLSRATVASLTGLTRSTTSTLVTDLLERGLVRELGVNVGQRVGRPATLIELDGTGLAAIGMELNVGALTTTVVDLGGRVLLEGRRPLHSAERPLGELVGEVLHEIADVRGKIGDDIDIIGLGLAVAGLVDSQTGVVHVAPNLGWHDEPVGEQLHRALAPTDLHPVPIVIDNEANFGALAEHSRGRADGVDDFVYVLAEHGVGGGVISGGRLISGANGYAGEVGHMTLVRGGDRCGCGSRGCWETLIGLPAMLRSAVPDVAEAVIADDLLSPEDKVAVVVERARRGDRIAVTALDELGEWFGIGVGNLVDVFNPRLVVIAGALAEVAEWIVPAAMRVLARGTVAANAAGCEIHTSSLGHRAASLGAALTCIERVHADPTAVRRETALLPHETSGATR